MSGCVLQRVGVSNKGWGVSYGGWVCLTEDGVCWGCVLQRMGVSNKGWCGGVSYGGWVCLNRGRCVLTEDGCVLQRMGVSYRG